MTTTQAPPAPASGTPSDPSPSKPVVKRPYDIVRRGTGTLDDLMEFLKKYVEEGTTTEITVTVGKAVANTPTVAMKAFGDKVDVDGVYETVADQAFKKFGPLSTESKRKVVGL